MFFYLNSVKPAQDLSPYKWHGFVSHRSGLYGRMLTMHDDVVNSYAPCEIRSSILLIIVISFKNKFKPMYSSNALWYIITGMLV